MDAKDGLIDHLEKELEETKKRLAETEERVASQMLGALEELAIGVNVPSMSAYVFLPPKDDNGVDVPWDERVKHVVLNTLQVEGWFRVLRDKFEDARRWNLLDMERREAKEARRRVREITDLNTFLRRALANCVKAMNQWGQEEDGIPDEFGPFWDDAAQLLGVTLTDTGRIDADGGVIYNVVWPVGVHPYDNEEKHLRSAMKTLKNTLATYSRYAGHHEDCIHKTRGGCTCGWGYIEMMYGHEVERVCREVED